MRGMAAMIRIGTVWDSTTDVLAGRAGLLAPIAAAAFLLPAVLQAAIKAYGGGTAGAAAANGIVALLAIVPALWGQLAIIAVASDPSTTARQGGAAAGRRLPFALLAVLVLLGLVIAAALPIALLLLASGFDFAGFARTPGSAAPGIAPGVALAIRLYALFLAGASLWFSARTTTLLPVVLHEARGIGAIGRSLQLTRGLTVRLIGVIVLFFLTFAIAGWAARATVFVVARLLLGEGGENTAAFLGSVAVALVNAAFAVILAVFAARLYAALHESRTPSSLLA